MCFPKKLLVKIVKHAINVKDSSPIKQIPRQIPIQMRGKIDKIIEKMKEQGVIEESQAPGLLLF